MNKSIVASFILALAAFALIGFVYPQFQSVMDTRAEFEEKEEALALKQKAQTNIRSLKSEYDAHSDDVNTISVFLPSEERIEYIITSIETAANQSGVQLSSIDISEGLKSSKSKDSSQYETAAISLEVKCSYDSLKTMLSSLERSLRIYDVTNIGIQPDDYGSSLDVSLELKTYHLKDKTDEKTT